jgi:hypothetical protein
MDATAAQQRYSIGSRFTRVAERQKMLAACVASAISFASASANSTIPAAEAERARRNEQPSAIQVDNCSDAGAGSLREAMTAATSGQLVDASGLSCGVITLTTGQIEVSASSVTLLGPGRHALMLRNGGGSKYANRIFSHTGTGQLALQGLTLADGTMAGSASSPNAFGGCIYSAGSVVLGNPLQTGVHSLGVDVIGCRAVASAADEGGRAAGGGVFAQELTLINSTVSDCEVTSHTPNVAHAGPDGGGGVYASFSLAMYASELSDNDVTGSQYGGGGAVVKFGSALIINSLIAQNHDDALVGGLYALGPTILRNTTVSGNFGAAAGGFLGSQFEDVVISNSTITANGTPATGLGGGVTLLSDVNDLESTIISGNFRGTSFSDIWGLNAIVGANNLVGVAVVGTPALPPDTLIGFDPLLGPLRSNGGPTRTHFLQASSPAIDAGNNEAGEENDQRGSGFPRVVGVAPDTGAVEFSREILFSNGFELD